MVVQPLTRTLLSLPRYARILGINPVHFIGAYGDTFWPLESNRCNDIWVRYSWQRSDQVSHEDLSLAIEDAENEIAMVLGYFPAPKWFANELNHFASYYRPGYGGGSRGKSVQAKWKKFISQGRRATTLVGTATIADNTLQFLDLDNDTYFETARIILPTELLNPCEIKVYIAGEDADEGWEIRPTRTKTISGGFVTIDMDIWLIIDPELFYYPTITSGVSPVNIDTNANYVTSLDVYREYTDTTAVSSQFIWESSCGYCGGAGCAECTLAMQDGCLHVRDAENSIVVPNPGSYDVDLAQWVGSEFAVCSDPRLVKLWYYAGLLDNRYLRGLTCDPLSDWWASTIAMLATTRLDRPFCSCGMASGYADKMQTDLAHLGQSNSYLIDRKMLNNPFGTRHGEVAVWKRVSQLGERLFDAVVV